MGRLDFIEFDDVDVKEEELETSFDYIELDEDRKVSTSKYIVCKNCGALNPPDANFCIDCQRELVNFRPMELEEKPLKVVLKFPKNTKYIFCPLCGAANEKGSLYCKDCAAKLDVEK